MTAAVAFFLFFFPTDLRIARADSFFEIENYPAAESLYAEALASVLGRDRAYCLKGLGNIRFSRGAFDDAIKYYNEAAEIFRKEKDRRGEVKIMINLGSIAVYRGMPEEALKYFDRALNTIKKIKDKTMDDSKDELAVLLNTGQVYEERREFGRARANYLNALRIASESSFARGAADSYYHLASVFQSGGEADSALAYFERAQGSFRAIGDGKGAADCLREAGNVHRRLAEYSAALDCFYQALDLIGGSKGGSSGLLGEADLYMYIGRLYIELGKNRDALQNFTVAGKLFEGSQDQRGITAVMEGNAQAYLALGVYDSARYYYGKARETARTRAQEAFLLNNEGVVYEKSGDPGAAIKKYQLALEYFYSLNDSIGGAKAMCNIGNCAFIQGDYATAISAYKSALSTALKAGRPDWQSSIYANLGLAQHRSGAIDDAIRSVSSAVERIEALRGGIVSQEFRATYFEDKIRVYEELVGLYCEKGDAANAFDTAERAKARAFLDLMGSVDLGKRPDIDPRVRAFIEREQALARNVEFLTGSPGQPAAVVEHARVMDSLTLLWPEYAALRAARPISVRDLQSILDDRTALVEYFLGTRRGYVFVVTNRSIGVQPLTMEPAAIYQAVDSLRREVRRKGDFTTYGRLLFNVLMAPVYAEIKPMERVGIVPHGVLHHLPFSILILPGEPARLLIEDHDVFFVPSASVYEIARRRNTLRKGRAVIFAKSDFKEHPDWFDVPLPGTNIEKDSLVARMVFKHAAVYSDKDSAAPPPTEANAKKAMGSFDIIHFATHGKLDDASPLDSRIVLGADQAEDGNLKVREIFNQDLDAYLVTLSACETGRLKTFAESGKYGAGDELTGLSRSFIYAGAASVIASLWKVSDASTAQLMVDFYEGLKKADPGNSKVRSLCAAQRRLMTSEYYKEPFYWAPFVVIGDWR